ncbi:MAG: PAS domain S-box protein [Leptolyngbya sp.]|nr:PAS domain S-box protein [Candidatus Melainabacteria bacterium]
MKNRLTRDLLIIVSIPLTFEIALFSTCAIMLNLAEFERLNESRTINVLTQMAPVLVSTIRSVTLAARSYSKQELIKKSEYVYESQLFQEQLLTLQKAGSNLELPENKAQINRINQNAQKMISIIAQNVEAESPSSLSLVEIYQLRSAFTIIDKSAGRVLEYFAKERAQLEEKDLVFRNAFHKILWSGLFSSFIVAVVCLYLFDKLVRTPLKDLIKQSKSYALGTRLKPSKQANNEIGDLSKSFEKMADELESQSRLERAIFDNSGDIICTLDGNLNLKFLNMAAEKMLGFERDALLGRNISAILPKENATHVVSQLNEVRAKISQGSFESVLQRKDGKTLAVVWSIRWSNQENLFYCCLCDIDFEKTTELMAKELRSILVNELTESLSQAKILVSEIDLNEIPNPKKITQLDGNFSKIIGLLANLGEAISNESTDIKITTSDCSLRELIDSSLETVKGLLVQKELSTVISADDTRVQVDSSQIQRVIVNLVSNAIKVSPVAGSIFINAKLENNKEHFSVEVTDQGPGIPLNKQHLLFERFAQVSKIESVEGKGSGLGLFSARSIVESHGGTVGVLSDGINGCTFKFSLPTRPKPE